MRLMWNAAMAASTRARRSAAAEEGGPALGAGTAWETDAVKMGFSHVAGVVTTLGLTNAAKRMVSFGHALS